MRGIFKNRYGTMRSGWIILICMALYYVLQDAVSNGVMWLLRQIMVQTGDLNPVTGESSPLVDWLNNTALPIGFQILLEIITIGLVLAAWKIMKQPWKDLGLSSFGGRFKKDGLAGLALGFFNCTIIFLILLITGNAVVSSFKLHFSPKICWWIFTFILVGIGEEILNRGLIMSILRRTNNVYLIMLVPSIIFGLIHLMNPNVTFLSVMNIILVGIVFSFMYYKSGNLWMCMGYHITWNIFQSTIYGMPVSGMNVPAALSTGFPLDNLLNGGAFGIEGGILTTIVNVLTFFFVRYYYRSSKYQFLPQTD